MTHIAKSIEFSGHSKHTFSIIDTWFYDKKICESTNSCCYPLIFNTTNKNIIYDILLNFNFNVQ